MRGVLCTIFLLSNVAAFFQLRWRVFFENLSPLTCTTVDPARIEKWRRAEILSIDYFLYGTWGVLIIQLTLVLWGLAGRFLFFLFSLFLVFVGLSAAALIEAMKIKNEERVEGSNECEQDESQRSAKYRDSLERAMSLLKTRTYSEALRAFQRLERMGPPDAVVKYNAAVCCAILGHQERAQLYLEHAFALRPECRVDALNDSSFLALHRWINDSIPNEEVDGGNCPHEKRCNSTVVSQRMSSFEGTLLPARPDIITCACLAVFGFSVNLILAVTVFLLLFDGSTLENIYVVHIMLLQCLLLIVLALTWRMRQWGFAGKVYQGVFLAFLFVWFNKSVPTWADAPNLNPLLVIAPQVILMCVVATYKLEKFK